MGNGKGNVEYWVAVVQPGRMLYEIEGVTEVEAREAFRLAAAKLSVQTSIRQPHGAVMELKELRKQSAADLTTSSSSCAANNSTCACRSGAGNQTQTHHFKRVRREIAQINTLLTQQATSSRRWRKPLRRRSRPRKNLRRRNKASP